MPIPPLSPYPLPRDTYSSTVNWTLDPTRAALLVHDMQDYFLRAYDTTQEPAGAVLNNIRALIDHADQAGIPVFYSVQPPDQAPDRRGLLTDMWGEGMKSSADAAVVPQLAPRPHHHVITKWRYSAFNRTDLLPSLNFAKRDQLIITGVYGHMGCKVSAVDAFMNDIQPFMVSDAIADFTAADHRATLEWVAKRCGRVIDTSDALTCINGLGNSQASEYERA